LALLKVALHYLHMLLHSFLADEPSIGSDVPDEGRPSEESRSVGDTALGRKTTDTKETVFEQERELRRKDYERLTAPVKQSAEFISSEVIRLQPRVKKMEEARATRIADEAQRRQEAASLADARHAKEEAERLMTQKEKREKAEEAKQQETGAAQASIAGYKLQQAKASLKKAAHVIDQSSNDVREEISENTSTQRALQREIRENTSEARKRASEFRREHEKLVDEIEAAEYGTFLKERERRMKSDFTREAQKLSDAQKEAKAQLKKLQEALPKLRSLSSRLSELARHAAEYERSKDPAQATKDLMAELQRLNAVIEQSRRLRFTFLRRVA
jgi:DNA repair exonuclease SbcCD ATPase subunit